jgi:hypothetical protein
MLLQSWRRLSCSRSVSEPQLKKNLPVGFYPMEGPIKGSASNVSEVFFLGARRTDEVQRRVSIRRI